MNRTDELTDRLLDGTIKDAGAVELNALLEADPNAQARHLALVRLELVLRGLRTEFDLAGPTVAKIATERLERTTTAVMTELADRRAGAGRAARHPRILAAFAALAVALLLAVWLGTRAPNPAPHTPHEGAAVETPPRQGDPGNGVPVKPELARLTMMSGTVEVVGPGGAAPARAGQVLEREQTVRTAGEESTVVVEFPDRGRVEIHPETAVRLMPVAGGGDAWKVFLVQGRVTAVATGRRLVVGVGAADVDVGRGSFSVYSSGPGSARVESLGGDVRVVRGGPTEPVLLGPGRAAFVRDEQASVRVESPRKPQNTPLDQLAFPGALDVIFAERGEVWAASAKQLVRWHPASGGKPATTERQLFASPASNDGAAAVLSADRRTLVAFRGDDKDDRVTLRDLPGGDVRKVLPVRVTEPRFLCAPPDASWVATVDPKPADPKAANRVRVWDAATGAERFARDWESRPSCLASTPDGKWLAAEVPGSARGADNPVVFLNAATGEEAFALPTRRRPVTALGFGPDGRVMAAGFNGAVQIWDVPGRKLLRTLEGFERVVSRVAFSPKGDLVAVGTHDGQVWVWSVATGRRAQVIETGTRVVQSLAFSPDGKLLVTATNKAGVAVWEVAPEPAKDPDPDA